MGREIVSRARGRIFLQSPSSSVVIKKKRDIKTVSRRQGFFRGDGFLQAGGNRILYMYTTRSEKAKYMFRGKTSRTTISRIGPGGEQDNGRLSLIEPRRLFILPTKVELRV